jgi:hypothetical protein
MSVAVVEDSPTAPARLRRRWWGLAAGGVALVVILAVGWAAWWLTHPNVLFPLGNGVGTKMVVGETNAYGTTIITDRGHDGNGSQPVTITIHRVTPVVTENTANANVSVVLCEGPQAGSVGAVTAADVAQLCQTTTPVADESKFSFNYLKGQQLIVLITPRQPGVVVIHGFQVTYQDGLRRGTQLTGVNIKVHARAR